MPFRVYNATVIYQLEEYISSAFNGLHGIGPLPKPRKSVVKILNPIPGQSAFLSGKNALRVVKSLRAEWIVEGKLLKLTRLNDDQIDAINRHVAQARGYDHATLHKMSSHQEIAALPCVNPIALLTRQTTEGNGR